jgi:hypothetical protein
MHLVCMLVCAYISKSIKIIISKSIKIIISEIDMMTNNEFEQNSGILTENPVVKKFKRVTAKLI